MKSRFCVLMVLLSVLMLTASETFSATWTNTSSNNTFSFTGTTVSTSRYLAGRGTPVYQVTGSADISGTADALGDNTVYKAEMYLMVSGDLNTSAFPSKDNIDEQKITNGVFYDTHTSGSAKILYKSHPVGSLANSEHNPLSDQTQNSLSDSTSKSYVDTDPTSPSGLSASPEVYGSLSGTMMNHVGSKTVDPLTFKSDPNSVSGSDSDDGSGNVASEKCQRKQLCKKPKTATTATSHRVSCSEDRWIWEGVKIFGGQFFEKKEPCDGVWWTCDDRPDVCPRTASHVPASQKSWKQKYVAPDGTVSQYPPTLPCGHSATASGNHQSVNYACGSHSYYACQTPSTSSHSLQASCSSTKNGSACTVTSFYACQSHTHVYPAPPPPPTATCANGHTYNPNSTYAKNYHRTRTCRYSECGRQWQKCTTPITPICNKPYRKRNGLRCWAIQ